MIKTDKLAILLATYNGGLYLSEQLDSLLSQTYQDFVVYIHDDGSQDNTLEIISRYKDNNKIVLVEGNRQGSSKNNFFFLLNKIDAPIYMFSDQDDVWKQDKIEKFMNCYEEYKNKEEPILIFSDLYVVDERLNIINGSLMKYQHLNPNHTTTNRLLIQNVATGCSTLINKATRDMAIKAINIHKLIEHDWWCALVCSRFGEIKYIDESLVYYRQHRKNMVGAKKINSISYIKSKISNIEDIKQSLMKTHKQAEEFMNVYKENEESLISKYSMITRNNKIKRELFYFSNKVTKTGLIRNIGLVLFG